MLNAKSNEQGIGGEQRIPLQQVCCSVAQLCPLLGDPMDCSTAGFLVFHCLPEFAQTHVLWVNDAIQPSHALSSPSPPAFSLSQHPGLFQLVSSSHQVAKVLSFSFSISPSNENSGFVSFRIDWFDLLAVQGTLKSLFSTTVLKYHFFDTQPSCSKSLNCTWLLTHSVIFSVSLCQTDNFKLKTVASWLYFSAEFK